MTDDWRDVGRPSAVSLFITLGLLIAAGVVLLIGVCLIGFMLAHG